MESTKAVNCFYYNLTVLLDNIIMRQRDRETGSEKERTTLSLLPLHLLYMLTVCQESITLSGGTHTSSSIVVLVVVVVATKSQV